MHALDTEEAIRHHIARLAGDDRTSIVDLVVAEGDLGAARLKMTSTDPTRLLATWNETHVFRVENGAIAEHWPHTPEKRVEALLGGYEPPFSPTPLGAAVGAGDHVRYLGVSEHLVTQLRRALGRDAGRHARSAVGVAALPMDAPVEVEAIVEVG